MNNKRQAVQDKILDVISTMDHTGYNTQRYTDMFNSMDDQAFNQYMLDLRDKKTKLMIFTPNLKVSLKNENLMAASQKVGVKLFEKIRMQDSTTGTHFTTPIDYFILRLPIRRVKQFLMHKLSVSESDKKIDNLTGQVIKPDKAASLSFVEAQLLYSRGLTSTITEYLKVRGGDVHAFSSYKQQLEETGSFQLNSLDANTVPRSAVVMSVLLKCMYFDNNVV